MTIHNLSPFNAFTLTLILGIGVGTFFCLGIPPSNKPLPVLRKLDIIIAALFGTLAGGRITYVLINWKYYKNSMGEIGQFWLGGISWTGTLLGSLLAVCFWSRFQKISFTKALDMLLPLLSATIISVWIGTWLLGSAYGREVDAWWGVPAVDEWGIPANRWPIPIFGILSALVVHLSASRIKNQGKGFFPGLASCLGLAGFSATMLFLSFVREDPVPELAGLRLDAWASIGYLIISITFAIIFYINKESGQLSRKVK